MSNTDSDGMFCEEKTKRMMHRILLIKGEVGYSSIDSITYACFLASSFISRIKA